MSNKLLLVYDILVLCSLLQTVAVALAGLPKRSVCAGTTVTAACRCADAAGHRLQG